MRRWLPIALVMLLFVPAAHAGVHVGGSIGSSSVEVDESGIDFDESDTAWKVFGGFRFIKFFGVEASYVDLGEPEDSSLDVDVSTINIFGMGIIPLGERFEIFGKAGWHKWDIEAEMSGSDEDDDGTDFAYGVGAAFKFTRLAIRAEYEVFEVDPDADVDVDMVSVGLEFRF